MNIEELSAIETEEGVEFSLKPDDKIAVKGKAAGVDRALERIAPIATR